MKTKMNFRLLVLTVLIFATLHSNQSQITSNDLMITDVYSDSLVDVFPLSIGNKWVYDYYDYRYFYKPPNWKTDSGKIEIEVIGRQLLGDTVIWALQVHKLTRFHYLSPYEDNGIDTTYDIDTTIFRDLFELQDERHQLLSGCYSIDFQFGCFDTTKIYRYQFLDSSEYATIIDEIPFDQHLVFRQYEGLIYDSVFIGIGGTEQRVLKLISSTILPVIEVIHFVPTEFHLFQNYPNPFNPITTIEYSLPAAEHVKLSVYNVLGEKISTLVNEMQTPGVYKTEWNADKLPSGVYFYRVEAGKFVQTNKLLLIK